MWALLARVLAWEPVADAITRLAFRRPVDAVLWGNGVAALQSRWVFNACDPLTGRARWRWCPISVQVAHVRAACSPPATLGGTSTHVFTLIGALLTGKGAYHAGSHRCVPPGHWDDVVSVSPMLGAVELIVTRLA